MQVSLQPGYVLHRRPYRDRSVLIETLTASHGRVGLLARGRSGSAAGALAPFRPLLLSWRGTGELRTLTASEIAGPLAPLAGEPLVCGLYLNELLLRLLQRGPALPQVFVAYGAALAALADGAPAAPALRQFEFALLEALGYGLSLGSDVRSGRPLAPDRDYVFLPGVGLCEASRDSPDSARLSGQALIALAQGEWAGPAGRAARRLARAALGELLGPEPLRSRALLAAAQRGRAPGG